METLYDMFMYPVSAVMKLWHLLFQNVFGLEDSISWLISIPFLIVTVRGLIAPLTWYSARSGRIGALIRPRMQALDKEYAEVTDTDEIREYQKKKQALFDEYSYRPAMGCIPPLIMIPVFIGLYRLLLLMANPLEGGSGDVGADAAADAGAAAGVADAAGAGAGIAPAESIGLLTAAEVSDFRNTEFLGIPLPAFASMGPDLEQAFGITTDEVISGMMPALLLAIAFTVINLVISTFRAFYTTEWSNALARRLFKFMIIMSVFVPVMLFFVAFNVPIPWAIIIYWFINNLWTLVQSLLFIVMVRVRYPLREEHHEARRESHQLFRQRKKDRKQRKRERKRENKRARKDPKYAKELAAAREEQQRVTEQERAEKKELRKKQQQARLEISRQRRAEKAAKKAGTGEESGAAESEEAARSDEPADGRHDSERD
ncbi:membrane protein insertase YidC [Corynebacterium propinquum]|uniref:membrane protein insertase YidC n=1 Tax=Corynebacterium propinquum TaxID=43769 RepID=UPI001EF3D0C5|nr:membrane protein insertase YidC [Corynebacterium propinquum]MCG7232318.1 membrane protein insertase YidC [Corynebacterium propinquum]MDK4303563.1 membrane protein insertase YidC [Corynebacterium propinquum]WKS44767.1 membrane protein insertase YidC [Corynebacterium propinquum]